MSTNGNPLSKSPARLIAPHAHDVAAAVGVDDGTDSSSPASPAEASNPLLATTDGSKELPLIDVAEFAAKLGVSPQHIRRMSDAGRCPPPIRLGRLVRWGRKIVDDWIATGCPVVRQPRLRSGKRD